jgi:DNA-binding MarR family transcriptional regulator
VDGIDYEEAANELMRLFAPPHGQATDRMHRHVKGEGFVLHCLMHHSGMALPSEISSEMDVSSARVAAILNQLEQKKYVRREIDAADRRNIRLRKKPLSEQQVAA